MKLYETINEKNWRKGAYEFGQPGKPGRLLHHLQLNRSCEFGDEYARLRAAIKLLYPERVACIGSITTFADHPDTTLEDILRVCKVADV